MGVTRVTGQATQDEMTEQDYREIYLELAQGKSPRQIERILGLYSNAWWGEFGKGHKPLTREVKAALRGAMGLDELPPTVLEAVGAADPDAEVWIARANGKENPLDLVIVAERVPGLVLRVEGIDVSVALENAENAAVRAVTPHCGEQRRARNGRVSVTAATVAQNARRRSLGVTWAEVIEAGLTDCERRE